MTQYGIAIRVSTLSTYHVYSVGLKIQFFNKKMKWKMKVVLLICVVDGLSLNKARYNLNGVVQNAVWHMSRKPFPVGIHAIVERLWTPNLIPGLSPIPVAMFADNSSFQNVATNASSFVIQDLVHHVRKWYAMTVTAAILRQQLDVVSRKNGRVASLVDENSIVINIDVLHLVMMQNVYLAIRLAFSYACADVIKRLVIVPAQYGNAKKYVANPLIVDIMCVMRSVMMVNVHRAN